MTDPQKLQVVKRKQNRTDLGAALNWSTDRDHLLAWLLLASGTLILLCDIPLAIQRFTLLDILPLAVGVLLLLSGRWLLNDRQDGA